MKATTGCKKLYLQPKNPTKEKCHKKQSRPTIEKPRTSPKSAHKIPQIKHSGTPPDTTSYRPPVGTLHQPNRRNRGPQIQENP